ncbi:TPA: hypothetical protein DHW58_02470 [Patescibacteria group bacterium]|uniref:Uncharacterized protein n=2 Tax=Bacteria division Kazan-3B-28 TaxID=1798534 RepID=A0A0G2A3R8_UNCK3|nr:MAG: hypothetical protein VE98_C0001G0170 [candidate division Kazan bacterium GW2011_GWA1_50_15]KKW25553.1 MAG: hypothetical protein VE99_C0001G0190 [candidate division Kazan bacterium GW2011_GWC1_52_13]KKW26859.1 MAG: hypothetical protein VF00_C0002G0184 [candidate division Kazan bacterium GW2011_GWB1_52_7]HAV65853.1 hypothetical protein [Patescibacteria group bacterium]HCL47832.1 hypothetical protein [Patescibacteria group bacterium]
MSNRPHFLLQLIRWDLRATLALALGLVILVGWSLAASDAMIAFDFGTASFADLNSGDIRVSGGVSLYPQTSGTISFGWVSPDITEFSDGANVSNKRNRDYNGGQPPNTFRISGLPVGSYKFSATVGTASGTLSTRMTIGDKTTTITKSDGWGTISLITNVGGDSVDINFSSANGGDSWGINALLINLSTGAVPQPGFSLSAVPATQQVIAGGVATFAIGITPFNNYTGTVSFSAAGITPGVTAAFVPSQLSSLPGSSELRLATTAQTSPTIYEVLVTAAGNDSQVVTKTAMVKLVVIAGSEPSPPTQPGGEVVSPDAVSPRSDQEVKDEFALVDQYVQQVEQQRLVQPKEVVELQTISDSMAGFPLGTFELPPPKTSLEASLQFLTRAGIIDSTLSTASRSDQRAPKPLGFWARFWGAVSSPVQ